MVGLWLVAVGGIELLVVVVLLGGEEDLLRLVLVFGGVSPCVRTDSDALSRSTGGGGRGEGLRVGELVVVPVL